jgi:hypothetical protein
MSRSLSLPNHLLGNSELMRLNIGVIRGIRREEITPTLTLDRSDQHSTISTHASSSRLSFVDCILACLCLRQGTVNSRIIVEDKAEAKSCYLEAEALANGEARASAVGDYAKLDRSLDHIRRELDDLECELDPDWTEEGEEVAIAAQEAFDEEQRAEAAAEDDDPLEMDDEIDALDIVADDTRKVYLD